MSDTFRIPSGDQQSNSTPPVTDVQFDEIYRNQAQVPSYYRQNVEQGVHPVSGRIYEIAKNLAQARENLLYVKFFTESEKRKNFTNSVVSLIFGKDISARSLEPLTEERLKKEESTVGANIFGETKPNEHIEFFNDNEKSWFFYQSISDESGADHSVTLHYEVHDTGVLRISSHEETPNEFISGQELDNFKLATEIYHDRVMNLIYNQPTTKSGDVISIDSSKKAA